MPTCDSCAVALATQQVTFPDHQVFFVCDGCTPGSDIIHRVVWHPAIDEDLEVMFA